MSRELLVLGAILSRKSPVETLLSRDSLELGTVYKKKFPYQII